MWFFAYLLEKVLEDRRIRGRQQQLKELNEERQRYEEAIREEENIIAKLREKNAEQAVINEELVIVDKNKQIIEKLDMQINEPTSSVWCNYVIIWAVPRRRSARLTQLGSLTSRRASTPNSHSPCGGGSWSGSCSSTCPARWV